MGLKDVGYMKPSNGMFEETMEMLGRHGYGIAYVSHAVMEDCNATYNVMYEGYHMATGATKKLGIPLSEIWISELWKPLERFVAFHELREIRYRAEGSDGPDAHIKGGQDGESLWGDGPLWVQMVAEVGEVDRIIEERKRGKRSIC